MPNFWVIYAAMSRRINIKGYNQNGLASASKPGLLSAADKRKLENLLDYSLQLSDDTPSILTIGTSGTPGIGSDAARADHVHEVVHGNLLGGSLHAIATTTSSGFMSSADKLKLDMLSPGTGGASSGGWSVYVWNESPDGARNGSNRVFTLDQSPVPIESLIVFKNGLALKPGITYDYTATGKVITFNSPVTPLTVDVILASYTTGETLYIHVNGDSPTGSLNGINDDFTLSYTPLPVSSLKLFKNGLIQRVGSPNDYTLSGNTVTFVSGNIPQSPDTLIAYYTRGTQL